MSGASARVANAPAPPEFHASTRDAAGAIHDPGCGGGRLLALQPVFHRDPALRLGLEAAGWRLLPSGGRSTAEPTERLAVG
ncbi:MAG: hypothetical protein AAFR47_24780, partial [Pseudomonadota bacterium]